MILIIKRRFCPKMCIRDSRIGNKYEDVNWTIKLDTTGQIIWDVTDSIYYTRQNFHFTAGLELAPSGSIYVGGYVEVDELEPGRQAFVIKYTSDGCSDTLCLSLIHI